MLPDGNFRWTFPALTGVGGFWRGHSPVFVHTKALGS